MSGLFDTFVRTPGTRGTGGMEMAQSIKIMVVDDHTLFRVGLVRLLKNQPDFKVVGEASTVAEAVKLTSELHPDLILMDFRLPDGDGLEATQLIHTFVPSIKIVFLTIYESDELLFAAIRSGAKGYLLKNIPVSHLVEMLRGVVRGEAAISLAMAARILEEFARREWLNDDGQAVINNLTTRELEILKEIASGASNREIANKLVLSENTIKNHVHNILEKLKLPNRHQAAVFALHHRLVEKSR